MKNKKIVIEIDEEKAMALAKSGIKCLSVRTKLGLTGISKILREQILTQIDSGKWNQFLENWKRYTGNGNNTESTSKKIRFYRCPDCRKLLMAKKLVTPDRGRKWEFPQAISDEEAKEWLE